MHYTPDTVLDIRYIKLFYPSLWDRYRHRPHFIDEETGAEMESLAQGHLSQYPNRAQGYKLLTTTAHVLKHSTEVLHEPPDQRPPPKMACEQIDVSEWTSNPETGQGNRV